MRRTLLALLLLPAFVPGVSHAACAGLTDPVGDATLADGTLLSGRYDKPVPAPSLDIVAGDLRVTPRGSELSIRVVDLAAATTDGPSGVQYVWEANTVDRAVWLIASATPAESTVEVYAGSTTRTATLVTRYAATVLDPGQDTVRFFVPAAVLAKAGLRPGVPAASRLRSYRLVMVSTDRTVAESSPADHTASNGRKPWGRC